MILNRKGVKGLILKNSLPPAFLWLDTGLC